jgi:signal transduction histidine kinase/CheY-like chemotaxis protein
MSAKLTVSFLIVTLLTAVVGIVGISVVVVEHNNIQLLNRRMTMGANCSRMMRNIHQQRAAYSNAALFLEMGEKNASLQSLDTIDELDDIFYEYADLLEDMLILQASRDYLDIVAASYAEYAVSRDRFLELLHDPDVSMQSMSPAFIELSARADALMDAGMDFTDHLDGLTNAQEVDSQRVTRAVIVTLVLAMMIAMCVSLLLGNYVADIIARPIDACVRRIKLILDHGDLHSPVEVFDSRDETGVLSKTMRDLIENIGNIVGEQSHALGAMADGDYIQELRAVYRGDFEPIGVSNRHLQDALLTSRKEILAATRRAMETELQTRAAQAASDAKSTFLATMSHEIRTPMNAIIGMSELIRTDNMDGEQLDFFNDIKKMSRVLLAILNDILDFSKIEAGKMELAPVHFDLLDLYDNMTSLNAFMAKNKGLEFRSNFDTDVRRILYADDVRIRQVITNILNNAIKYTHAGFVDFQVKRHVEKGTEYTAFVVVDSGVGIEKNNLSKLFDAFEQFDTRKNYGIVGTGLGLSIAKRLVELMHGKITVSSEYGKGSVFTVLLPLPEGDPDEIKRDDHLNRVIVHDRVNVLVVDDNPINVKVALIYLAKHNIQADSAESGAFASEKAREKKYHMIFIDHMMPEMDGLETTARIRALDAWDGWYREAPVIALSANVISGARELFLANGMNDFLAKPIDANDLNKILAKWLPPDMIYQMPELPLKDILQEAYPFFLSAADTEEDAALLDREEGISNSADSETLYLQLLADFHVSHGNDLAKISAALKSADYKTAHRLAHTLKSTSALIGAKRLSRAALAVEKTLHENQAVPSERLWSVLEQAFLATSAVLAGFVPKLADVVPSAGSLDKTKALAFIKKLEPLLRTSDTGSMRLLDDIREILAPAGDEYQELITLIEDFEFMKAAEILNLIHEKIVA